MFFQESTRDNLRDCATRIEVTFTLSITVIPVGVEGYLQYANNTMTLLSYFRELYSLDTLDTRLTTSSKTPAKVANDESAKTVTKDVRLASQRAEGTSPPRWYTPEFYFYALVFIFCVPQMYKAVVDVSLSE